MFNMKSITIILFIIVVILGGVTLGRMKEKREHADKVILAQNTRKVIDILMLDLRAASQGSVLGLPADGQWHERIAFDLAKGDPIEYFLERGRLDRFYNKKRVMVAEHISSLRMRREADDPSLVEVEIKTRNRSSLDSNFKIRMQE